MPALAVDPVPCLRDNYAYLVRRPGERDAVVVDPGEAAPVLEALERGGLRLVAILCTHHHGDHVGGNLDLARRLGPLPVFGHRSDRGRIPLLDQQLEHLDRFQAAGLEFLALHVPGHTLGAVTYVTEGSAFTGDTLFGAGCGRLFEGTPSQLHHSLHRVLGELPASTLVYCGHEYTLANLKFARHVEPQGAAIAARVARVQEARRAGLPSVPFTLEEDRATNPFLRCDEPGVRSAMRDRLRELGCDDPATAPAPLVFAALRGAKDGFSA